MNHIGNVIREYRAESGMSRSEFAKDICSEKYVYLIEKCQRTPSANMIRLFSNRLGIDLFDYFKYLGCKDPIAVRRIMNKIMLYRKNGNYKMAHHLMDEAAELPDFHQTPWSYEFEINRLSSLLYSQRNHDEAIPDLEKLAATIAPEFSNDVYMANIYTLLATAYQLAGNLDSSKGVLALAEGIIEGKEESARYADIVISVKHASIATLYSSGMFNEVIQNANTLLNHQVAHGAFERAFSTFFYLAFASYEIGLVEEAIEWFKKGIYSVLIRDYSPDVFFVLSEDIFAELLLASGLNKGIICELQDKYNI